MKVISDRGFRMAHDRGDTPTPFVFHFFGADTETGLLVHLHVYFRIITGGSILKNTWIRVENMFLESAEPRGPAGVFIPSAEADLILFVLRKFVEQPSIIEHYLFLKDWHNIKNELNWLTEQVSVDEIHRLLLKWLPFISIDLFNACLETLNRKSSIPERVMLGRKIRKCLTNTIYSEQKASILRTIMFFGAHARGKLGLMRNNRVLFPGGMLIAFVGSEASGKSTLSKSAATWLAERFDVTHVHLGKPEKNWRTKLGWIAISIYSRIKATFTKDNDSTSEVSPADDRISLNQPHPIVAVLDAIDRKYFLKKNLRKVMEGSIVITDRFPTPNKEGVDGPRIDSTTKFGLYLARLEKQNYEALPQPDFVFKVIAPLDITLVRNSQRERPEPEGFVRARYLLAKNINFDQSKVINVDTTKSLEKTTLAVKRTIWTSGEIIQKKK